MWKKIDNIYSVSCEGEIKNDITNRILKPDLNSKGYYRVTIKGKHQFIHRIVAKHFIPNHDNKLQVNHIDHNKSNNNYLNLEWVTNKENTLCSFNNGRISGATKLNIDQVKHILECITNKSLSVIELSKLYNVKPVTIYSIKQGRNIKRLSIV